MAWNVPYKSLERHIRIIKYRSGKIYIINDISYVYIVKSYTIIIIKNNRVRQFVVSSWNIRRLLRYHGASEGKRGGTGSDVLSRASSTSSSDVHITKYACIGWNILWVNLVCSQRYNAICVFEYLIVFNAYIIHQRTPAITSRLWASLALSFSLFPCRQC